MKVIRSRFLFCCLLTIVSVAYYSCSRKPEPVPDRHHVTSKTELYRFLDTLEHRYELACIERGREEWDRIRGGTSVGPGLSRGMFEAIFSDTAAEAILAEWRAQSSSLADKPLARRLELWHRCFIGGILESNQAIVRLRDSIQQIISGFIVTRNGTPALISHIDAALRSENKQPARRAMWESQTKLSAAIRPQLLRLIRAQNAFARKTGFPNYISLALYLQTIDEEWLLKTLSLVEEQTKESAEKFATSERKKLRLKKLGPWDIEYAMNDAASFPDRYFPSDSSIALVKRLEAYLGFGVDTLPIRTELGNISMDAAGVPVSIPSDTRIVINQTDGRATYEATAREYGRALKYALTRVEYPIQKGYAWIPGTRCEGFDDGMAGMHEAFVGDSLWLITHTKLKGRQIQRTLAMEQIPALIRFRMKLKDFALAYAMYRDPDLDFAQTDFTLFRKFLAIEMDSTKDTSSAELWKTFTAASIVTAIFSDMAAAQLQEALTSKFGERKTQDTTIGDWMTSHLYSMGETLEWTERMKNATGKSLEPGPYLRSLGVEPMHLITRESEDDTTADIK